MARLKINGGKPLVGNVKISGAKNEALKIIPLTILLNGSVKIKNIPIIKDVLSELEIIKSIGGEYSFSGNELTIDCSKISKNNITSALAARLRASIVLIGPLLARFGKVNCPYPGGCLIGSRPIDTHLDAFRQLGAVVNENKRYIYLKLEELKSSTVVLKEQSVSATENIALFACGREECIEIRNCATEPEVVDLMRNMQSLGIKIEGIGTRNVKITGKKIILPKTLAVMPDRIEAATFMIAFIVTGGKGTISPFPNKELEPFIDAIKKAGAKFEITGERAIVTPNGILKPIQIKTAPHPGFPTDLQSPMALIGARGNGVTRINETMYENRLTYINELKSMGMKAKIIDKHNVEIYGPTVFKPKVIKSLDLRSGITMVIAGLIAKGETIIEDSEIIDRGYERIEEKFSKLGANIERIS